MRQLMSRSLILLLIVQVGCASNSWSLTKKSSKGEKPSADYQVARRLEGDEKYEEARAAYKKLLDKQPDNPEYLHRMGVVCTRLQRDGEARSYYERARQHDPKNVTLLTDMGYSAYVRGNYMEAERLLRDALKLKPADKRATSNLALVLGSRGKPEESLELLRSIGDEASALAGLAYIHAKRGQFELAEKRYREALKTDPNFKEAANALAQLEKQRSRREEPKPAGVQVASAKKSDIAPKKAAASDFEDTTIANFQDEIESESAGIVQVGGVSGTRKKAVATANFFEESTDDFEATETKVSVKLQTASFTDDEADSFAEEETIIKVKTAAVETEEQPAATSWDDDWSSEEQPKSAPAEVTAKEDEFADEPAVEAEEPAKAVPAKKIPLRKAAPALPKDIRSLLESDSQEADSSKSSETEPVPELSEAVEQTSVQTDEDGFKTPRRRMTKSVADQLMDLDR